MKPSIFYYYYAGCQRRRLRNRRMEAEAAAKEEKEKIPVESAPERSARRNLSEDNRRCGPNSKNS